VREIADWFRSTGIPLNSVHSPLYGDYESSAPSKSPSRSPSVSWCNTSAPTTNLSTSANLKPL
jgi:hypothetical protein